MDKPRNWSADIDRLEHEAEAWERLARRCWYDLAKRQRLRTRAANAWDLAKALRVVQYDAEIVSELLLATTRAHREDYANAR